VTVELLPAGTTKDKIQERSESGVGKTGAGGLGTVGFRLPKFYCEVAVRTKSLIRIRPSATFSPRRRFGVTVGAARCLLLMQVFCWINRSATDKNFIMQVGSGGTARHSHGADDLAPPHFLSHDHRKGAEVGILGSQAIPMVN